MPNKKYKISTPSLLAVDESFSDDRFMKVRIDVLESDTEARGHGFRMSRECLENSKDSFANIPILANMVTKKDKDGNEILEINPDVSIVFKTSPSSLFELIPFQNNKYLFYVCDVDSKKETCDIVKRVTLATFDAVKNPLVLEKTMQYLDKSIRLLNMKGVRISVLLGLVDTMNMKISFINASLYSLFTSKKNENSPLMPLVSNKYILATEKQLPFIVSEYRICKDDLISIAMEENI